MAVLDRAELEASPLADLHAIARELGIDGYRLLGREQLIASILAGAAMTARDLRERAAAVREDDVEELDRGAARRRPTRRRGERSRPEAAAGPSTLKGGEVVEGKVALRERGGAELLVERDGAAERVLIAPSQVKRCELKNGDRVSGPIRRRRGQGFALVRVEKINGVDADKAVTPPAPEPERAAPASRKSQQPKQKGPTFPDSQLALGSSDPLLAEVEALAPLGFGSRAAIVGPTLAGKSELARRLARALAARKEVQAQVVLCGVRPEELGAWHDLGLPLATELTFEAGEKERLAALQTAIAKAEQALRRGRHGLVLIDTLDGISAEAARRLMAKARNEPGRGTLTLIATSTQPLGGETTVIALRGGGSLELDPQLSGTLRVELLVGEQGAQRIARERERRLRRRRSLLSRLLGG